VELRLGLAVAARVVAGDAGGLGEGRGARAVDRVQRDAEMRAEHELVLADAEGRAQLVEDRTREARGLVGCRGAAAHQHELATAPARQQRAAVDLGQLGARQAAPHTLGGQAQHRVARFVAEAVADALVALERDVDDRDLLVLAAARELGAERLQEVVAVGQAGEGIVAEEVVDALLDAALRGDVLHRAVGALGAALLVVLELHAQVDPADAAVVAQVAVDDVRRQAPAAGRGDRRTHALEVLRMHPLHEALDRALRSVRVATEHREQLLRALGEPADAVQLPAPQAGDALRLGEVAPAALEGAQVVAGAQQEAHPMHQDVEVERLGDEVRGAGVEGVLDGLAVVVRGHHQHRQGAAPGPGAQPAAEGQAAHAGHLEIEQDQVGPAVREAVLGGLAAVVLQHLVAGAAHRAADQQARHRVVVDDQHARRIRHVRCPPAPRRHSSPRRRP
jgi:hypothetical protein